MMSVPRITGTTAGSAVAGLCLFTLVTGCGSSAAKIVKSAQQTSSQGHTRQVAVAPAVHYSQQHRYAVQILPTLDRSVTELDRAIRAVASGSDLSTLGDTCSNYGDQINILASAFDGIPHPWPWYKPLGYLHHNTMNEYDYMLGALQACQTASSIGDSSGAGTAISDMSTADARLHGTDNYVRWLTHQP
jgi:hypothetical protein